MWPAGRGRSRPGRECCPTSIRRYSRQDSGRANPGPYRMRQHHRAERRWTEIDRLFAASFQRGEHLMGGAVGPASVRPRGRPCRRGLLPRSGEPRGRCRPASRRSRFQQRPAAGPVEFVKPVRELLRHFGLAERAQRRDAFGQGWRWRGSSWSGLSDSSASISATGSEVAAIVGPTETRWGSARSVITSRMRPASRAERERPRRPERIAAIGILDGTEIVREQGSLLLWPGS